MGNRGRRRRDGEDRFIMFQFSISLLLCSVGESSVHEKEEMRVLWTLVSQFSVERVTMFCIPFFIVC